MDFVQQWTVRTSWVTSTGVASVGTAGNLLIGMFASGTGTVTLPAEWSVIPITGTTEVCVLYKIAAGDSSDNLTVGHASTQYARISLLELAGVDTSDPIDTYVTGNHPRWTGTGDSLTSNQPYQATASKPGRGVAFLAIGQSSMLTDRYSPDTGDEYTFQNLHAAVLPPHSASDDVTFSWVQDNGSGDSVYPHRNALVLVNAAGGSAAPLLSDPFASGITATSVVPNVSVTF